MAFSNIPSVEELDMARRPAVKVRDESMVALVRQERIRKLVREKLKRKYEGLAMYQPLPLAEEFHQANVPFRIAGGSNRCLGGEQEIYDPVAGRSMRIDEINGPFHVVSVNPFSGKTFAARASRPFIKSYGDLYRFTLSSGETLVATMEHRVVAASGQWTSLRGAWHSCLPLAGCRVALARHKKHQRQHSKQSGCPQPASSRIDGELPLDQESFGFASSHPQRFGGLNCRNNSSLIKVEHLGQGEIWDITVEPYANYMAGGLINANSSKTLSCCAEAARCFCGCDPHDKYKKNNGQAWVVGLEMDQLTILYRKLFEPGAFKIIKDEDGKWRSVRPDPNNPKVIDPYDLAYCEKWRDAPPLIPDRMVRSKAWEDRAKDQPRQITFVNGWRSLWRSSKGDPPQGDEVHLALFDEEMLNLHFFYEVVRGMTYLGGNARYIPKMIWSATAQVGNIEFSGLCDRAEQGDKSVRLFDYLVDDNPYVSPEEKEKFFNSLPAGERETRYYGIRADKRRRCYPMWDPMTDWAHGGHGIEPIDIPPTQYCRWVYIDPGISPAEVLLVAVDQQESRKIVYDGFQMDGATGSKIAQALKDRERGMQFEGFVIDARMGRQSVMTNEETTVAQEYRKAFESVGLLPHQEGPMHGFFPSCPDVEARTRSLWRMMEPRRDGPYQGTAEICVLRGVLPQLDTQVRSAQTDPKNSKKRLKLTSNRPQRSSGMERGSGLLDDLEYLAAHDPKYYPPVQVADKSEATAWDHFQERQRINKQAARAHRRRERMRY